MQASERGRSQGSDEVTCKWSWVKTSATRDFELVEVIEDSASTSNFISPSLVGRLGLLLKPVLGQAPSHRTMTGQKFVSREYVDVPWVGREAEGTDRFYIAPPDAPIQMLVGRGFLYQHPGVFMDEQPSMNDALLTVQTKIKVPSTSLRTPR